MTSTRNPTAEARPLWAAAVTYGAIGATQAADMMQYPPAGYRPIERRARIGHGPARWEWATMAILTWGIQRGVGMLVEPVEAPADVTQTGYRPVTFDADGTPAGAATTAVRDEPRYGPDGTEYITAGDTAMLRIPLGPVRVAAPARVVYVVEEPNRVGFAYGTLPGHPESGEESFILDRSDDGSVWLTIRAVSRPAAWYWWAVYPVLRVMQELFTRKYLRALAVPLP